MNFAKSSVASLLIACFIFGGVAWRVHHRRCRGGACLKVKTVQIIPLSHCKACK